MVDYCNICYVYFKYIFDRWWKIFFFLRKLKYFDICLVLRYEGDFFFWDIVCCVKKGRFWLKKKEFNNWNLLILLFYFKKSFLFECVGFLMLV